MRMMVAFSVLFIHLFCCCYLITISLGMDACMKNYSAELRTM